MVPFRSKAQWRRMFAAEGRGEVPTGTARRFAHETRSSFARLPEHAHHSPVEPAALLDFVESEGWYGFYGDDYGHPDARSGQHADNDNVYFSAKKLRSSRSPKNAGAYYVFEFEAARGMFSVVHDRLSVREAREWTAFYARHPEEAGRHWGK